MRSGGLLWTSCSATSALGASVDLVALVLHGEAQGGTDAVVVLEDQELE